MVKKGEEEKGKERNEVGFDSMQNDYTQTLILLRSVVQVSLLAYACTVHLHPSDVDRNRHTENFLAC